MRAAPWVPSTHLLCMSISHFPWTEDMPRFRIAIAEDGTLAVWAFGITRDVPANLLHVDYMGHLFDYLYADAGGPYKVEVFEADSTRRVGDIDLGQQPPEPPQAARRALPMNDDGPFEPVTPPVVQPAPPLPPDEEMVRVSATGLYPSERVCVGLVVTEERADQDGTVSFLAPYRVVTKLPKGEVLIYGQASHTTTLALPLLDR